METQPANHLQQNHEPSATLRVVDSNELLQGQKTVVIHHEGERYRLFLTRNNRLILQK